MLTVKVKPLFHLFTSLRAPFKIKYSLKNAPIVTEAMTTPNNETTRTNWWGEKITGTALNIKTMLNNMMNSNIRLVSFNLSLTP